MRILFVNEQCGYLGGVEQNIADAAAALRQRGHTCYLAYGAPAERGAELYMVLFDGCFRCAELAPDRGAWGWGGTPFAQVMASVSPEVVYFHKVGDTGFCEPLLPGVRTVRMVHDHDLCCPRRHKYYALSGQVCNRQAGWRCWMDGAFLRRDSASPMGFRLVRLGPRLAEMRRNCRHDALLVGSHFMRDELLQNGFPPARVHVLPPVVRQAARPPSAVPAEPRILYVGQLVRGKGVDLLLGALQRIGGSFTARIAGSGNARGELEALCRRLELDGRVRFLGWVDHEDLEPLYAWAKVVVVPSRWPEPFGMIGLEAMRHGRAVVAFGVGGIPEWLEHGTTGLLVPPQDTAALAQALERVLGDTDLARTLGQNAYERGQQHYSFERYLDQLEAHLRGTPLAVREAMSAGQP